MEKFCNEGKGRCNHVQESCESAEEFVERIQK